MLLLHCPKRDFGAKNRSVLSKILIGFSGNPLELGKIGGDSRTRIFTAFPMQRGAESLENTAFSGFSHLPLSSVKFRHVRFCQLDSKCCVRNVPRVRIPNSPPKWKAGHKACFLLWQNKKRDSNKEGADLSAEENSPVDCFCRRGQGAKRREGIRQYAEKIPNSPPKREVMLWHCFSFFVWDSNNEGADLSAEENSPVDCFCRRGQGAKRREGIRQYAEKSLTLRQKEK